MELSVARQARQVSATFIPSAASSLHGPSSSSSSSSSSPSSSSLSVVPAMPPVDESRLAQLTAMGFADGATRRALVEAKETSTKRLVALRNPNGGAIAATAAPSATATATAAAAVSAHPRRSERGEASSLSSSPGWCLRWSVSTRRRRRPSGVTRTERPSGMV